MLIINVLTKNTIVFIIHYPQTHLYMKKEVQIIYMGHYLHINQKMKYLIIELGHNIVVMEIIEFLTFLKAVLVIM